MRQVEDVTGSRYLDPACRRLSNLVADPETTTPLCGNIRSDQAALFMESTACCTWRGAVEKARLNKARLHYTRLASHGQWATSVRSDKYEKTPKSRIWNVRTMFGKVSIVTEPSRQDIDIAALSNVRLTDEGSLQVRCTSFTLFWTRKSPTVFQV